MNVVILLLLIFFPIIKGKAQVLEQSQKIAIDNQRQIDRRPKLIVCYYAKWKDKNIDGNPCTHIIYAFVDVFNNGYFKDINQKEASKIPIAFYVNRYICDLIIIKL